MEDIEQLYHLYSKQLYKYLFYLCGDSILAEELLQETFYQAFKSIINFRGESKASTWLYKIGKNVYLKHLSKVKKDKWISIDENQDIVYPSNIEENLVHKEENIKLINTLFEMKTEFRDIIILRCFEELSFREIGAMFNQSEGWARTNFYRAKLQLKDLLSKK